MSKERGNIIPALVGCDRKTVTRLRREYGGRVHVFDDSCDIFIRLLPYVRFHCIYEIMPETLSMHINGFSESYPDNIVAVASSDKYKDMLEAASSEIESRCIILRKELSL